MNILSNKHRNIAGKIIEKIAGFFKKKGYLLSLLNSRDLKIQKINPLIILLTSPTFSLAITGTPHAKASPIFVGEHAFCEKEFFLKLNMTSEIPNNLIL